MVVRLLELMKNINLDIESKEEKNNGIGKRLKYDLRKSCRNKRRFEFENVKGYYIYFFKWFYMVNINMFL